VIDDGGSHSNLVLSDIDASDVTLSRNGASNDLVITDNTTGKTVTVRNQFNYLGDGTLATITFADSTVWTAPQVRQMLLDQESAAAGGSIYGYANSNDTLIAGLGDKYLNGDGGADAYVYSSAGGNDTIDDGGNQSKLVFTDVNSTDVSLATSSQSANDLVISDNATGKTVTVLGQFSGIAAGTLQSFAFADGVTWDATQVRLLADADTVYAGTGDKTLTGRNRALDYVYSSAGGNDAIDDGGDQSKLTFLDIASSDVSLSRSGASRDLVMTILSTGKTLTLVGQFSGIGAGTLQSITFADGVAWTPGQIKQMLLDQESAAVGGSVYGYANTADTLVAGVGDKYLNALGDVGGIGTYVYSSTGGSDTIDDGGNQSNLVLSDIDASDVSLSRSGASRDLVITDNATAKTVTVLGQFSGIGAGTLRTFTFADGTVWTAAQVKQMLLDQESAQAGGSIYGYANTTDTLVAGLGDKYLNALGDVGGIGTYVYSAADGNDVIDDGGDQSKLVFTDIRSTDVTLAISAADSRDLVITDTATGKAVTVKGQFSAIAAGTLQSFRFADGVSWTAQQVWAAVTDQADPNIVFHKGDGQLTLHPTGATTVSLDAGIAASDVVLEADSAGDLTVRLRDTGDTLTLAGDLSGQGWGIASVVGELSFADGSTISLNRPWSQPFTLTWLGEAGNMTLTGAGFGNNVYELGPNDVVNAAFGWGNTYQFAGGGGQVTNNVTINPTTGGNTFNTLQMGAGIAASDLIFATDAANDLIIKVAGTSDAITITNDLTPLWWGVASAVGEIDLADGTTIALGRNWGQNLTFTWDGTAGHATLAGSGLGNNVFELGAGDVVTGASGMPNLYEYAAGDGAVTINSVGGTDTLQMGAGITASELTFRTDAANDLIIDVNGTSDVITLANDLAGHWWGVSSNVGQIDFADGSTLGLGRNWGQNLTFQWNGAAGNMTITGSGLGNNVYQLGAGDVVNGTGTVNTYDYASGDGAVTINYNGGTDLIAMAAGITASDLTFQTDANSDLIIDVGGTSDAITLTNDLASHWWGVSSNIGQIDFADGSTLALSRNWGQNLTFTWNGSAGDTTLTGTGYGTNLFALGPGDVANGSNGTNTYAFARGDGAVTVNTNGGNDTIAMAAGITASDVTFETDASNDLIVDVDGTSDAITVTNDLASHWWGVSSNLGQIAFADGSTVGLSRDWGQNLTFTWQGGAGNTTLNGTGYGYNTFELAPGDTANAASGSTNAYQLGADFGAVTINNAGAAQSEVDFDPSLGADNLWFVQQGTNLQVDVLGTSNQLTLDGWFTSDRTAQVQSFDTADGARLDSGVAQLISAMATYSASNPGFNPATATQMPSDPTLQGAVAAAWHH